MKDVLNFMSESPFLTFMIALCLVAAIGNIFPLVIIKHEHKHEVEKDDGFRIKN